MQNTSSRRLTAEVTHIPGTGWNGLRVFDSLGGQEACWEDLTEDETRLLKLAADMEHTEDCLDSFTGSDRRSAGLKEKFS